LDGASIEVTALRHAVYRGYELIKENAVGRMLHIDIPFAGVNGEILIGAVGHKVQRSAGIIAGMTARPGAITRKNGNDIFLKRHLGWQIRAWVRRIDRFMLASA
jgi:hypothetical protein